MEKYVLNKHVKYRLEGDEILVCDCRNLNNLWFPAKYLGDFKNLEAGASIDADDEFYQDLLMLNAIKPK